MSQHIEDLKVRLEDLMGRPARFEAKGLHSRIPGVLADIECTRKALHAAIASKKWADEIAAARAKRAAA